MVDDEDGINVLIVDDEETILELLDEYLSERGYNVDAVKNGLIALSMIKSGKYHAIVTDIDMPIMDGIGLYKSLEVSAPHMKDKVIFISGSEYDYDEHIKSLGQPLLKKPFKLSKLDSTIKTIK